jgi:hypothetical protein
MAKKIPEIDEGGSGVFNNIVKYTSANKSKTIVALVVFACIVLYGMAS